jgi:hypothetical protein
MSVFYVFSDSDKDPPPARLQSIVWRYASMQDIVDYHANVLALNAAARTDKGLESNAESFPISGSGSDDRYRKFLGFLRTISGGAELPPEFMFLYGEYSEPCGTPPDWTFAINSPGIALDMMLVRNSSEHEIEVDSLLAEKISETQIGRAHV